MFDGVLGY